MHKVAGAVYPDDVLQGIAHELLRLHTFRESDIASALDPDVSIEVWNKSDHFMLYLIEYAIRANPRLHPSSRLRLTQMLVEEWAASRKPSLPKDSPVGIFARAMLLVLGTGFGVKLEKNIYSRSKAMYDTCLYSVERTSHLKEFTDTEVLAFAFFHHVRDGKTSKGQQIRFGGDRSEMDTLCDLVGKCFADAAQRIQNRAY